MGNQSPRRASSSILVMRTCILQAGKHHAHACHARIYVCLTYAAAAGAHRRLTAFNSVKLHLISLLLVDNNSVFILYFPAIDIAMYIYIPPASLWG